MAGRGRAASFNPVEIYGPGSRGNIAQDLEDLRISPTSEAPTEVISSPTPDQAEETFSHDNAEACLNLNDLAAPVGSIEESRPLDGVICIIKPPAFQHKTAFTIPPKQWILTYTILWWYARGEEWILSDSIQRLSGVVFKENVTDLKHFSNKLKLFLQHCQEWVEVKWDPIGGMWARLRPLPLSKKQMKPSHMFDVSKSKDLRRNVKHAIEEEEELAENVEELAEVFPLPTPEARDLPQKLRVEIYLLLLSHFPGGMDNTQVGQAYNRKYNAALKSTCSNVDHLRILDTDMRDVVRTVKRSTVHSHAFARLDIRFTGEPTEYFLQILDQHHLRERFLQEQAQFTLVHIPSPVQEEVPQPVEIPIDAPVTFQPLQEEFPSFSASNPSPKAREQEKLRQLILNDLRGETVSLAAIHKKLIRGIRLKFYIFNHLDFGAMVEQDYLDLLAEDVEIEQCPGPEAETLIRLKDNIIRSAEFQPISNSTSAASLSDAPEEEMPNFRRNSSENVLNNGQFDRESPRLTPNTQALNRLMKSNARTNSRIEAHHNRGAEANLIKLGEDREAEEKAEEAFQFLSDVVLTEMRDVKLSDIALLFRVQRLKRGYRDGNSFSKLAHDILLEKILQSSDLVVDRNHDSGSPCVTIRDF